MEEGKTALTCIIVDGASAASAATVRSSKWKFAIYNIIIFIYIQRATSC